MVLRRAVSVVRLLSRFQAARLAAVATASMVAALAPESTRAVITSAGRAASPVLIRSSLLAMCHHFVSTTRPQVAGKFRQGRSDLGHFVYGGLCCRLQGGQGLPD